MIKLIKPYISYAEVEQEFRDIFESGWFTRGHHVGDFASRLKEYTGAKHAFLTTSATTALWACLRLLDIGPGDEVIVSDFSFPATANVVEDVGATPVFADVSLETYNMLPEQLERRITPHTRAVIFVDALGNPSGLHDIRDICQSHSLPLIEDAACAIGSSEFGVRCGNVADMTCFSFHPRKLLTTGEGGALTLNNPDWAARMTIKLAHGADTSQGFFDFIDYGYNFRMSEIQAVMGIKQLAKLDAIVSDRIRIRDAFVAELITLGFWVQAITDDVCHNVQSLVFRVPEGVDRDALITGLREYGVESTLGTYCLSNTTYFKGKYDAVQPNAKLLQNTTITLPCYEGIDVNFVCDKVRKALMTAK